MKAILYLSVLALFISGCSKKGEEVPAEEKRVVYTVNYPLAYFAERIAGDKIDIVFPEMEGDPAFWNPPPEEIGKFQNADLILLNGAHYAKWISMVSLPQSKLVDTSIAFKERLIEIDDSVTHTHGPGGEHAHGDLAFTTWIDPQLAILQAAAVRDAFSTRWKKDAPGFAEGFRSLEKDLLELDANLEQAFSGMGKQPLIGSHPVYQYLTRRYDLNMVSIHWEPDEAPDVKLWSELREILKAHPAKIMLWEDEPLVETKVKLKEMGIKSIVFSPCGNRPAADDYLSVMKSNLRNL